MTFIFSSCTLRSRMFPDNNAGWGGAERGEYRNIRINLLDTSSFLPPVQNRKWNVSRSEGSGLVFSSWLPGMLERGRGRGRSLETSYFVEELVNGDR